MIYLMLVAAALSFGLLGFLLNAFYFSKSGMVESLSKELEKLRKVLKDREKGTRDAQEEIANSRMRIRLLERQLEQRNEELNVLQYMALRRDEKIDLFQKAATEIHLAVIHAEDSPKAYEQPDPAFSPNEVETKAPPVHLHLLQDPRSEALTAADERKNQDIPLWKRKLNNILSILDTMEKELER